MKIDKSPWPYWCSGLDARQRHRMAKSYGRTVKRLITEGRKAGRSGHALMRVARAYASAWTCMAYVAPGPWDAPTARLTLRAVLGRQS